MDCPAVILGAVYDLCERTGVRQLPMAIVQWAIGQANPEGDMSVISLTPPCARTERGYPGSRVRLNSLMLYRRAKRGEESLGLGDLANVGVSFELDPWAGAGNGWCNGGLLYIAPEELRKVVARIPSDMLGYWENILVEMARQSTQLLGDSDEWVDGEEV